MQETRGKNRSTGKLVVHFLLGVYAIILAYIILGLLFKFTVSADKFFGLSFALLFFTLAQAIYELGFRNALIFLLITSTIGFLAEVLGTNSGFPFGKYYYTDFLGEKAFGVPVVVPLVWFVIAYIAFSIARSAFAGGIKGKMNSNSLVFQ
ncbi:MAG: carotenoid biosynthesis protein, partial [Nitrososphaerales archaeon]